MPSKSIFSRFPPEILSYLLDFLDDTTLVKVMTYLGRFSPLLFRDGRLWGNLFEQHYGTRAVRAPALFTVSFYPFELPIAASQSNDYRLFRYCAISRTRFATQFQVINRDITQCQQIDRYAMDAWAFPTNRKLYPGGGVASSIGRVAGDELIQYITGHQHQIKDQFGEKNPAFHTPGFNTNVPSLVHCLGPSLYTHNREKKLRTTYLTALNLMERKGLRNIAFASISTGILQYPPVEAAKICCTTMNDFLKESPTWKGHIFMVINAQATFEVFMNCRDKMIQEYAHYL